jgi:TonB family protein
MPQGQDRSGKYQERIMSDEQANGPRTSKERHVSHSSTAGGSNKTGILLAGAAALALLVGGGYYVWQNAGSNQVASIDNNAAFSASEYDQPIVGDATTEKGAIGAGPALTEDQTITESGAQKTAAAQPKKARIAAAAIPEETIGVSQASTSGSAITTSQSDEVVVSPMQRPVWRYTPRPERLSEYYPTRALDRGREGEASLHCIVGKKGMMDCESVSETPARSGFGAAAVRVARTFRHAEQRADGASAIGTPVNLRVLFRMEEGRRRG